MKCANCATELPPDKPGADRQPCPTCGSTARTLEGSAAIVATSTVSAELTVQRGVNEARMTGFTVILASALSVGLAVGFASGPWFGLLAAALAALASALLLAAIYRVPAVRHRVMSLMHRITGQ